MARLIRLEEKTVRVVDFEQPSVIFVLDEFGDASGYWVVSGEYTDLERLMVTVSQVDDMMKTLMTASLYTR